MLRQGVFEQWFARFCETCASEMERQGRGCPIGRTAIQMIMHLF